MATDLTPVYAAAAKEWNLDPAFLQSVSQVESGQQANGPNSSAGAMGPMQVMPGTAAEMGVTDPHDPVQNVYAGAKYLSQMLDRYQSPELALAAYNAGPGRVDDYLAGKATLPAETQAYVPKVAAAYGQMTASASAAPPTQQPYQVASADTGSMTDAAPDPSAPPPAVAPPASGGSRPAPDPFSQLVQAAQASAGNTPAPAAAAASPLSAPVAASPAASGANPSASAPQAGTDPFLSLITAASQAGSGQGSAPAAPSSPPAGAGANPPASSGIAAPGLMSRIGAGIDSAASAAAPVLKTIGAGGVQGVDDVAHTINNAAAYVDQRVPALAALDRQTGADPVAAAPGYASAEQAYDQQYAGNPLASVGRIGGNMLAAAPFVVAGGAGLGAAGGALAEAAGGTATALGRGIQAGSDVLAGTAGAPNSGRAVNALVRGGSLATNNALQGAGYAGLSSAGSDQALSDQMLTGAEAGAVLGPAAGAAGWALGKVGDIGSALVQPFYQGGRDAIVDRVLQKAAAGGPVTPDLTAYVPGSTPTLAQATANPGVAAVERAVQAVRPNQFDALAQANDDARAAALEGVRGDPASLQDLIDNRAQNASQTYDQAFGSNTVPVDPQPVVDQIDSILASPAGQRDAVQSALGNIRSKLVIQDAQPAVPATGSTPAIPAVPAQLQTDPAQLYGIRQQITDLLAPASQSTMPSAKLAASQLGQIKDTLDPIIEQGAPGYHQAQATYAADSQPVGQQQYLQGKNFTNSAGNITLGNVDRVVKAIQTQQALPGARAADSITPGAMDTLTGLRSDLQRAGNSSLGKPIGSNTFQNLAVNNLVGSMGAPLAAVATAAHGPLAGALTYGGKLLYGSQNDAILDTLANRLLNPNAAATLAPAAPGVVANALTGARNVLAPVGAISYRNRLAAAQ